MQDDLISYLLFDLGMAPYVRSALPYLYYIDVLAVWMLKPVLLCMYPFYWILGCNTDQPHKLLTCIYDCHSVVEPSFESTVRIVDGYCSESDVGLFMVLTVLACIVVWKITAGFVWHK
jgi:hypothetical protein